MQIVSPAAFDGQVLIPQAQKNMTLLNYEQVWGHWTVIQTFFIL